MTFGRETPYDKRINRQTYIFNNNNNEKTKFVSVGPQSNMNKDISRTKFYNDESRRQLFTCINAEEFDEDFEDENDTTRISSFIDIIL